MYTHLIYRNLMKFDVMMRMFIFGLYWRRDIIEALDVAFNVTKIKQSKENRKYKGRVFFEEFNAKVIKVIFVYIHTRE